ncbi:ComEA family DNA-binding protein [Amnibacterium setariae]|uniref:ComEA family DNA-binding protein n=1 Tax=Amnibacterium setariae TaxID=2306585 RepID=A0A3A1TZ99_9MICO|nr:ComEA family DNA-binding protein [Amnibacterium setariae]
MPRERRLPLALAAGAALLVLVAAVLVAAGQAAGSTTEPSPVAVRHAEPSPAQTPVLVHVTGAVRRPGLVALPTGARLIDAVTAAGGPRPSADLGAVNLAARVVDGQQVAVPERGAPRSSAPPAAAGGSAAPVSLSTATAEQLDALPQIGPALAARIVAYREAHGPFGAVGDLAQVGGIGPKTIAGLRDLVTP